MLKPSLSHVWIVCLVLTILVVFSKSLIEHNNNYKKSNYLSIIHHCMQGKEKQFSQREQDVFIECFFLLIKPETKYYVEFGFNTDTMEGGSGSNTANLYINLKWNGLLLDGSFSNPDINLHKHYIQSDTISSLFHRYNVPHNLDYLSIDIDSCDIWVLRAILSSGFTPTLISIEYNSNWGSDQAVAFPNIPPTYSYSGTKFFGSSMKAIWLVAQEFGYELIHVEPLLDLFFVLKHKLKSNIILPPYSYFGKIANCLHNHRSLRKGENRFIDYIKWRENNWWKNTSLMNENDVDRYLYTKPMCRT